MALQPRYQWRRTRQHDTPGRVGRFFEGVAHRIFGGEPSNNGEGDIVDWKLGFGMEVKASDNNHSFRLPVDQIKHHGTLLGGFPLQWFLYGLFCYRNRTKRGYPRRSLLKCCQDEIATGQFLAQNVDALYILELPVIEALWKMYGSVFMRLPCQDGREVVQVQRTQLQTFLEADQRSLFEQMGLAPSQWIILHREFHWRQRIGLFDDQLTLPVTFVISQSLQKAWRGHLPRIANAALVSCS